MRPIFCLLFLVLTACGGPGPDGAGGSAGATGQGSAGGAGGAGGAGNGPPSGPVTLDNLGQLQLGRRCQAMTRCGFFQLEQNCLGMYATAALPRSSDYFGSLIAAGRMTFDPSLAQRCLDVWTSLACADVTDVAAPAMVEACAPMLRGTVAAEGACGFDFECSPGQWCNPDSASHQGTCAGRCAPRLGLGASTVHPAACQKDLVLRDGACQAPLALGGTCVTGFECASRFCAEGKCVNPGAAGGACTATRPCQGQLICVDGTCAERLGPGKACEPTRIGDCKVDLVCDPATRRCAERKGPGAECSATTGDCQLTLRCTPGDNGRGVCQSPGAMGARCREGTCAGTTYCDPASNTCQPLRAAGAACTHHVECGFGGCSAGTCKSIQFAVCQ